MMTRMTQLASNQELAVIVGE